MSQQRPSSSADRTLVVRNVVIALVVVAAAVALFALWDRDPSPAVPATDPPARDAAVGDDATGDEPAVAVIAELPTVSALEQSWIDALGSPPAWPDDLSSPRDCDRVEARLAAVCRALDARPYLRGLSSSGGVCRMIEEGGIALAERPPELASELRSHGAMLSNVYHVFRVLGAKRMRLLRRILNEEQELAEPTALALYRWVISREDCGDGAVAEIDLEVVYDYGTFLFSTMGGQAYLRRRSPRVEALTCFYALQILDRSIERGYNPHGIDPRPEIGRCAALLQSQPFVFADNYMAELQEIGERWARLDGG